MSSILLIRNLEVDGCQPNLHVMLKVTVFYKFYEFFCRRHSLMNRLCYDSLFQIMLYSNF